MHNHFSPTAGKIPVAHGLPNTFAGWHFRASATMNFGMVHRAMTGNNQ